MQMILVVMEGDVQGAVFTLGCVSHAFAGARGPTGQKIRNNKFPLTPSVMLHRHHWARLFSLPFFSERILCHALELKAFVPGILCDKDDDRKKH